MNETKFDWDDLRLFLAVARQGGLAAAEDITGKSAPTLGRRMLTLEKLLGQELFERLSHGYSLTEQGHALLNTALRLESEIDPLISAAQGKSARRVKISAGTWVTHFLSKHAKQLVGEQPIIVQFISADHVLDIAHREAVIGIRNQRPTQVSLAGRQTSTIKFAVYAANRNVDTWAHVLSSTPSAHWVKKNTEDSSVIEVTDPRNALDLAIAGVVKTVLPTFIGESTSGIQQVSEVITELEHMQWLVTHHEDRHFPEVRFVIERLYEILSANSD